MRNVNLSEKLHADSSDSPTHTDANDRTESHFKSTRRKYSIFWVICVSYTYLAEKFLSDALFFVCFIVYACHSSFHHYQN